MYLDVQFLRKMIEKYKPRLRTINGRDPMIWWNEFIARIEKEQRDMCPECLKCLKKLASLRIKYRDPKKAEKRKQKRKADKDWRMHLDECKFSQPATFLPLIKRKDLGQIVPPLPSATTDPAENLQEFALLDSGTTSP